MTMLDLCSLDLAFRSTLFTTPMGTGWAYREATLGRRFVLEVLFGNHAHQALLETEVHTLT